VTRLRRRTGAQNVTTTRTPDGGEVIVTVTTATGTIRIAVPRGSLNLPIPDVSPAAPEPVGALPLAETSR
jgi:hypothetical protein